MIKNDLAVGIFLVVNAHGVMVSHIPFDEHTWWHIGAMAFCQVVMLVGAKMIAEEVL